ncbi:MAG: hypothetical protein FWC62_09840 [Firmicutes bacterium]|nr:hypothetical protein [Bacillota bacterium]
MKRVKRYLPLVLACSLVIGLVQLTACKNINSAFPTKDNPTPDTSVTIGAYDALIADWKSALNDYRSSGNSAADGLSFHFYDESCASSAKAYYAFYDIDGNGVPELILNKRTDAEDIVAYI